MSAPCYKCEDREFLCHSNCGEYRKYKEECDLIRRNRRIRGEAAAIDTHLYEVRSGRKARER